MNTKAVERFAMLILISVLMFLSGCMHMGMMGIGAKELKSTDVTGISSFPSWDAMIAESVADLSKHDLLVINLAVWGIRTGEGNVDGEIIKLKLIKALHDTDRFQVVTRDRVDSILTEQGLSQSGAVNEETAVQIGKLLGVDGFVDGYASVESDKAILSLILIDTQSGLILWSKTIEDSERR